MKKFGVWLKNNKNNIFIYAGLMLTILVLNRARVVSSISPFSPAFALAMVCLQKNAILLGIWQFLCYVLFNFSLQGVIEAASLVSAMMVYFLSLKLIKKKPNIYLTMVFLLLGQAGYIYFHLTGPEQIFITLASLVVSLMFAYIYVQAFSALFYRGVSSRFTLDESICFSLFLISFFAGLNNIYIGPVGLSNALVLLLILLASRSFTKTFVIYFSALAGFGMALASASVMPLAIYVTYGVIAACLSSSKRIFAPVGILFIDAVFGLFLSAYAYYSYLCVIPLLVVCVAYLCLPKSIFAFFRECSYSYEGSLANEYIVSGERENTKNKLLRLSGLFKQMQASYRSLSIGEIDRKSACMPLAEDVMARQCAGCPKYNACLENKKIAEAISSLFEFGMEKEKVTMIDANNLLTTSCISLAALIEEVNQMLSSYFEYEKTIKTADSGKLLVAEQLGSTGDIFNELAAGTIGNERMNANLSKTLLDEFTLAKIIVNEVVVLENEEGISKVIAIVRNSDVLKEEIMSTLTEVLKLRFMVAARKMTRLAGWSVLVFVPAPKYGVQIGFSSSAKEEKALSGDTYSFSKLSECKYLFALSDGMGHGERANRISSAALSLVESFYKSGFSGQTILTSVNRLLLPSGNEDNFASLDACVLDTSLGVVDFIKIGASVSVIKSQNTAKIVEGEGLPLGIMQKVRPSTRRVILKNQDIVVLASDGVVDSFDSPEEYLNFVNNDRVINVQMLADNLLEEAQARKNEHPDDKTVIAIKLIES